MATTNGTLNDNTALDDTITITQRTGTKITLNTANKYVPKDIELTCDVSDNNLTAGHIKNGVTILGVTGNYTGEGLLITETIDTHGGTIAEITATNNVMLQAKEVTPTISGITVLPDEGYNALSQVVVQPVSSNVQLQAKSVSATTSQQIITPDNGYDGLSSVTIARVPAIDWLGQDSTVIKTITRNIALKDLPTFNEWARTGTTAAVLRASPAAADSETFVADFSQYEYVIAQQLYVDFVYTGEPATAIKGKAIREVYQNFQFLAQRPQVGNNVSTHVLNNNFNSAVCYSYISGLAMATYNAAGTQLVPGYAPGYGIYLSNQASTFSNANTNNPTVTIREPVINGRCSATWLATAYAQLLDTTNTIAKLTIKVYRVNKSSSWKRGEYETLLDLYHNGGGT